MSAAIHVVHVLAAGIWLGGLVFTATVVSPAFKRMEWTPLERIAARSAVGRQYSKVARVNLAVLLLVALIDASACGWSSPRSAEIALIIAVFILSEMHARAFRAAFRTGRRTGRS